MIDPIDFETEPTTWLGNVILNGMRPVPRHHIRVWEIGGGHVAIVNVDPMSEPPCGTSSGEIFERVSGGSDVFDFRLELHSRQRARLASTSLALPCGDSTRRLADGNGGQSRCPRASVLRTGAANCRSAGCPS